MLVGRGGEGRGTGEKCSLKWQKHDEISVVKSE